MLCNVKTCLLIDLHNPDIRVGVFYYGDLILI